MAEATALRNNVLEYPIYGEPYTIVFPYMDADGDLVTGATTPDSEVSKNGDTFADCTNEATEIATSSGMYYLTLTATEMTADIVAIISKSATAGMKTTPIVLYPRKLAQIRTGTCAGGDTAYVTLDGSASAVNDYYNGCLVSCVIDTVREVRVITDYTGSNQRAAVTPAWNTAPDNDDTFIVYATDMRAFLDATATVSGTVDANVIQISGDSTAADNAEAFFDGTGYAGGTAKLTVDLNKILGTTLTETVGGYLAAAFKKLFDVATPVLTAASKDQTGDSFPLVSTEVAEIYAAVITNAAGVDIAADIIAVKADVAGLAGAAMRGTDSAALASVCTEGRLSELDAITAGKLAYVADVIAVDVAGLDGAAMRGTDSAALASVCTEGRLAELDAANLPTDVAAVKTEIEASTVLAKEASLGTAQTGDLYGLVTGADTQLSTVPTTTSSIVNKIKYVFEYFRNKRAVSLTTETLYREDAITTLGTAPLSDDGTTRTKGEMS